MEQTVSEAAERLLKYINEQWVDDEVRFDGEKLNKFRSGHFQKLLDDLSDALNEEITGQLIEVQPDPNIERIAGALEGIQKILEEKMSYDYVLH